MKSIVRYSLFGVLLILAACSAHSPRVLDARYQTIHIPVVHNETPEFGLEERMTHALIDAFKRDGQLKVVREDDADLILKVRVASVSYIPHTFSDLDRAVGYRMHVRLLVDVEDTTSGDLLYKDMPFQSEGDFILSTSPTASTSRDVTAVLSESILSFLVEGW